jgi:hypothetical protein
MVFKHVRVIFKHVLKEKTWDILGLCFLYRIFLLKFDTQKIRNSNAELNDITHKR